MSLPGVGIRERHPSWEEWAAHLGVWCHIPKKEPGEVARQERYSRGKQVNGGNFLSQPWLQSDPPGVSSLVNYHTHLPGASPGPLHLSLRNHSSKYHHLFQVQG